jgi:hypothetical protein
MRTQSRWVLGFAVLASLSAFAAPRAAAQLFPTPQFDVGDPPWGLVAADFDGDGRIDLASLTLVDHDVRVFAGSGNGQFALAFTQGVPQSPVEIASGDLDGDGDIDLAVSAGVGFVSILRNQGGFTFTGATNTLSPNTPQGIALGDVDEDGDLDAVASTWFPGGVNVHLNVGGGTLAAATSYAASGHNCGDVLLLDVGLDGHLDAVVCTLAGQLDVLPGDGSGAFGAPVSHVLGTKGNPLAAGELNGDGWPDIVAVRPDIYGVTGLRSDGAGGFEPPVSFSSSLVYAPQAVAIADLDGDGANDILLGSDERIAVAYGNGFGGLKDLQLFHSGVGTRTVVPVDFDADGALDVVAANATGRTVVALRGDGEGGLVTADVVPSTSLFGVVAAGDLDEDGDVDLAAAGSAVVATLANDGDGGFTLGAGTATQPDQTSAVVRDFDGDGHLDLLTTNYSVQRVVLHLGDGDGGFAPGSSIDLPAPVGSAAGDVDGDGDVDAVVASFGSLVPDSGQVHVLLNDGSGAFTPVAYSAGVLPRSPALVDLDGDLDLDLLWVIGNASASSVARMLNDGAGGFSALATTAYPSASAMAVGDVDADGDVDVVAVANSLHTRATLLNDGHGGLGAPVVEPTLVSPGSVALADVDCDGHLDVVADSSYSGGIGVHRGDGAGGFGEAELFMTGAHAEGLVIADFDADGHADVASVHPGDGVHVLLGATETGWCGLGGGLSGTHGIPQLTGTGTLAGGTSVGLSLTSALENSAAVLVLGFSELGAPFKGGVLVPQPQILVAGLPTGPLGALALHATLPAGLPSHLQLYVQDVVLDPAAPAGLAISTAVLGTTP